MYDKARYLLSGDRGLVVEFGNAISIEINKKVRNMYIALQREKLDGIDEIIPTYRSLLVQYNPLLIGIDELIKKLEALEKLLDNIEIPEPRVIEIPTIYGDKFGEDIGFVAQHNGLTIDEVIKIHSSVDYLIYMLGFTPGFPYLGGMPEQIETPRLKTPRTKIPAGSVGIAGKQTGIYPIESPGGWQLIGRTPVKLYDPKRETPIILQVGDFLRFRPINLEEYEEISSLVESGQYEVKILTK